MILQKEVFFVVVVAITGLIQISRYANPPMPPSIYYIHIAAVSTLHQYTLKYK